MKISLKETSEVFEIEADKLKRACENTSPKWFLANRVRLVTVAHQDGYPIK